MTDKEYRESPGISRSELWRLNPATGGTPEKFMYAKNNPEPPTPAMLFGTLAHLALLEPSRFLEACRLFCLPYYPSGNFGLEGEQFAEWYAGRKKEAKP